MECRCYDSRTKFLHYSTSNSQTLKSRRAIHCAGDLHRYGHLVNCRIFRDCLSVHNRTLDYTTLKIVGGSYIIYLGIRLIISASKSSVVTNVRLENTQNNYLNWCKGLFTNLSNPKTAMFITSLFASVLPKEPTIFIGISIVTTMVLISLIWYSFVVVIFSSVKFNRYYDRVQKRVEGFAGFIFVAFGAKLVFGNK